jgi:8-oxo-dGTP pyrophosphatase MutT (NUDIX family)
MDFEAQLDDVRNRLQVGLERERADKRGGAAVVIPLLPGEDGLQVLFQVRAFDLPRQPGEVCFPGGHIETGETCVDAALRETYEELGILPSSVNALQKMEPEWHKEKMFVYPVLAEIDPFEPERLLLRQEEVSEVFTMPFAWLLSHEPAVYDISDPESEKLPVILRQYLRNYKRRSNTTYYWAYEQYGIWGLTARFLVRFKEILLAGKYQPTWKR